MGKEKGRFPGRTKKYEVLGNLTPGLPSLRGPADPRLTPSWVRLGGIRKTAMAAGRQRGYKCDAMVNVVLDSAHATNGPASHGWNYHLHSVIMFAYNVCTHVKSII